MGLESGEMDRVPNYTQSFSLRKCHKVVRKVLGYRKGLSVTVQCKVGELVSSCKNCMGRSKVSRGLHELANQGCHTRGSAQLWIVEEGGLLSIEE